MNTNRLLTGWTTLLLSAASVVCAPESGAQETEDANAVTVTGNVVDEVTGEPVAEVIVIVEALGLTFVTDAEGKFVVQDVARGVYDLKLIHKDYERLEGDLTIDRPGEFFLGLKPTDDPSEGMVTGIVGVVRDRASAEPIPEVVVTVPGIGRAVTTDADGRFAVPDLIPGRHEVVFSHLGYRQRAESISVETGHVSRADVVLTVEAIALDPIEVTVAREDRSLQTVGFYQREEDGWGHFVDREDLETWNPVELTDAFLRFPGVEIVSNPSNPLERYLAFRRTGDECYPIVYLDGIRMGDSAAHGGINDIVSPAAVAGVELYRGTAGIPAQYWGGSSCGVVLIWLRRGG